MPENKKHTKEFMLTGVISRSVSDTIREVFVNVAGT
jgi:hypothetical protein